MINYELIRSKRKTLAIYVRPDGSIDVRAPLKLSKPYIDTFVQAKSKWICETRDRLSKLQSQQKMIRLSFEEENEFKNKALAYFKSRCPIIADKMGVVYGKIKVNKAKTRWGSCNAKGDLSFTYRLIFAPEELIDYVIVHELAHLKEMNHSLRFWSIVENTMPDYKERRKELRGFQNKIEISKKPSLEDKL